MLKRFLGIIRFLYQREYSYSLKKLRWLRKRVFRRLGSRTLMFIRYASIDFFSVILAFMLCMLIALSLSYVFDGANEKIILASLLFSGSLAYILISILIKHPIDTELKMRRDLEARKILADIEDGKHPEFVFYIRRFSTDDGVSVILYERKFSLLSGMRNSSKQIESYFWDAAPLQRPVIKIGGRRSFADFGTGTIYYEKVKDEEGTKKLWGDAEWEKGFDKLSEASNIIVTVPLVEEGKSPALLKEIARLKEQKLLKKTIFIMPPKSKVRFYNDDLSKIENIRKSKDVWEESQKIFEAELGIKLPNYSPKGGFFLISENNEAQFFQSPSGRKWKERRTLRDVFLGKIVLSKLHTSFLFSIRQLKAFFFSAAGGFLLALALTALEIIQIDTSGKVEKTFFLGTCGFFALYTLANATTAFGKLKAIIALLLTAISLLLSIRATTLLFYNSAIIEIQNRDWVSSLVILVLFFLATCSMAYFLLPWQQKKVTI